MGLLQLMFLLGVKPSYFQTSGEGALFPPLVQQRFRGVLPCCWTSCLGICCHFCVAAYRMHPVFCSASLFPFCDSLRCGAYGTFAMAYNEM